MTVMHVPEQLSCFHCGLPVPPGSDYTAVIDGKRQPMCCPGCQAVAQTIVDGGLDNFYRHRDQSNVTPLAASAAEAATAELTLYDSKSVQDGFVRFVADDHAEATLVIEGITCAACVWLLEHHLSNHAGVQQFSVNLSNHRARLVWNPQACKLSTLFAEIGRIGYQAHPFHPNTEEVLLEQEKKRAIRRLGIAGLGMMQVMMMAIALYAGALQDMEERFVEFIRWSSLVITTPVVLYAAQPFFIAAVRDIRSRHLSMDVPVSIAIGGAYLASIWATLTNSGEVYYDSVTMFTFFLLIGRYVEMQARHRTGRAGNALMDLLPTSAMLLSADGHEKLIPATELKMGDRVLVRPGHTIPADGVIVDGRSAINESALTGEYLPVTKSVDDAVVGGTINVEHPIQVCITEVGANTRISAIVGLLDRAHAEKPMTARVADRVARYFVMAVLLTSVTVATGWYLVSPEDAFWVTLSVLVVTCPCALSLATPTALTAATGTLRQQGLLITRGHVLEGLASATHVIFDKTGTLTEGNLSIRKMVPIRSTTSLTPYNIAAALEQSSEHPIARAFHPHFTRAADDVKVEVSAGVEGSVQGERYRIGKPEYAAALSGQPLPQQPDQNLQWLLLADTQGAVAWFALDDQIRRDARTTVATLKHLGLQVGMLTGDDSSSAQRVADELGIDAVKQGVSPDEKLAFISQLQEQGASVVMVGDGINDIPVLAGARTSIAMGSATDLAKTSADAVLIASELERLAIALLVARKTRMVIRENLSWALLYNLVALPLAALGFIAPYMAAVGMSASSLIVVGNAMRLSRPPRIRRKSQE
ncbi:heavy metal translocating P-type ATPase [Marinobacterium weihaiense]|uniref:Cadmium-translocating P-type ATPase n=1 Tax=Marinobacterium weihaiense TaxID=2851016 RepID=A0ABS6M6R2_9GAMM|nr:heavy metal translocating P-type ATPase [Marinobacterium weihaiense]MBV0931974.1 cadmium-translocating P-type ATPase [Marinobacterium weihaiense]